ncbi:MAG: hypothetical protein COA69_11685 [Robiginitomaculum sp.]|nr:MAG: hypothetical protein COA69_11685 [Robiginitomaculum sp.]
MNLIVPHLSLPASEASTLAKKDDVSVEKKDARAWQSAKDFEAAFISQMLTYSGFAKALTASGGEDVASFSQFYMEAIAEDLAEGGGFGLADQIYESIVKKGKSHGDLGRL